MTVQDPPDGRELLGRKGPAQPRRCRFNNTLDDITATVRNARWRKVICAESLESLEPRNETARLRGGPQRPAEPGKHLILAAQIFPENLPSRQAENGRFRRRRSFAACSGQANEYL